MADAIAALWKQPYWIVALIVGAALVAFPIVTVDSENNWTTHPPSTLWPVFVGIALLLLSAAAFGSTLITSGKKDSGDVGSGLDLTRVREDNGEFWTTVGGCEVRVAYGRIEMYANRSGATIVLPCNEYFDDRCISDTRSALGAYVGRAFEGQCEEFIALTKAECRRRFGRGKEIQKTDSERGESFGPGRSILLTKPLGRSTHVGLVSTTTERVGEGLSGRITYLFEGMRALVTDLAHERLNEIVMPLMGAGHGSIAPPLALVGLLLAVAEVARYGHGAQRPKKATIVVFQRDENSPGDVDEVVIRRALALIASQD